MTRAFMSSEAVISILKSAPASLPSARACEVCKVVFIPGKGQHNKRACSPRCVQILRRANYSDKRRAELRESERKRVCEKKRREKAAAHMQAALMAIPQIQQIFQSEGAKHDE